MEYVPGSALAVAVAETTDGLEEFAERVPAESEPIDCSAFCRELNADCIPVSACCGDWQACDLLLHLLDGEGRDIQRPVELRLQRGGIRALARKRDRW